VPVIHALLRVAEDLDEDEEMVSPSQIAMQLVDWTDPRRLVDLNKSSNDLEALDQDTSMRNANIHVDLATTIMAQIQKGSSMSLHFFILTCGEEERKVMCSMLGKLYIPAEADADRLRELYDLVAESVSGKVVADALSKAALNKMEQSLGKIVGALEDE
jgi:condensin complex subunit 3